MYKSENVENGQKVPHNHKFLGRKPTLQNDISVFCSPSVLPFSKRFPPKGPSELLFVVLGCSPAPPHERQNLLKPMKNTHF